MKNVQKGDLNPWKNLKINFLFPIFLLSNFFLTNAQNYENWLGKNIENLFPNINHVLIDDLLMESSHYNKIKKSELNNIFPDDQQGIRHENLDESLNFYGIGRIDTIEGLSFYLYKALFKQDDYFDNKAFLVVYKNGQFKEHLMVYSKTSYIDPHFKNYGTYIQENKFLEFVSNSKKTNYFKLNNEMIKIPIKKFTIDQDKLNRVFDSYLVIDKKLFKENNILISTDHIKNFPEVSELTSINGESLDLKSSFFLKIDIESNYYYTINKFHINDDFRASEALKFKLNSNNTSYSISSIAKYLQLSTDLEIAETTRIKI
ncbi:hypothetical protein LY01_01368 [Nonlabens xylanidelens]|uniref:Uncharacterized protein n=2 Tax=Nonlabens xylanidelens TaxID=191564 RepID=A0A2S6INN4_9FLAO|nr:hypothetical protein [Nonlabens xylanidelens]PPK95775.1 hypothetical protein LY01_01368 [Nonlabens xylanidelens]